MPPARGRGAPLDGPRRRKSQPYMLPHRPGRLRLPHGPWRWLESRPGLPAGYFGSPEMSATGKPAIDYSRPKRCTERVDSAIGPPRGAIRRGSCPVSTVACQSGASWRSPMRARLPNARARVAAPCWDITAPTSAVAPRWDELLPVLSCHRAPVAHPAHYHIGPQGHLCGLPAGYFGGFGAPLRGSAGRAAVCDPHKAGGLAGAPRGPPSELDERRKKRRLRRPKVP